MQTVYPPESQSLCKLSSILLLVVVCCTLTLGGKQSSHLPKSDNFADRRKDKILSGLL